MRFSDWKAKWALWKQQALTVSWRRDPVRLGQIKVAVKREPLHGDDPTPGGSVTAPRLIQYNPNFATQQRQWRVYELQKAYTRALQGAEVDGRRVWFASGMNASHLSDWMTQAHLEGMRSAYERDGKRWDARVQRWHKEAVHRQYQRMAPRLAARLRQAIRVRAYARYETGLLSYTVDGTVLSGHNDTTLTNSLLNAAILVACVPRGSWVMVVGDDALVLSREDLDGVAIAAAEREHGIEPKYRVFRDLESVSFASGVWLRADSRYWYVPTPSRMLRRLYWTTTSVSPRKEDKYVSDVRAGLVGVAVSLPLVRVLLRGDVGQPLKPSFFAHQRYPALDFFPAYHRRYGLSRAQLQSVEAWMSMFDGQRVVLKHPVFTIMERVDFADVDGRPLP